MKLIHKHKKLSTFQIISLGFLLVIVTGSLLLMMPWSTRIYGGAKPLDAVFTATSAVCVTGLVVQDTATYWSFFGQVIILILIQIGGMGLVTLAVTIVRLSGRKIGLMQRSTMQEAIAAPHVGGIVRLTSFIFKTVIVIESVGALVMMPGFIEEFGVKRGVWYSIFHSISAFCNAGFDLMGVKEHYSSMTTYTSNVVVNVTIMGLIIVGGIGFLTWEDVKSHKFHLHKYRMQSKVILSVTLFLIIVPAIFFYFYEFSNPFWNHFSEKEKILGSLFQSVTLRTAGFNSIDLTKLGEPSQLIMVILMLIGGSPGSTAGGMKTTTIAVLFSCGFSVFKRKPSAHLFGRRIPEDTVHYAATIMLMYNTLFIIGGIVISCVDKIAVLPALFETASAIGTVGLSLGVTAQTGMISRCVLIALMYFGRVGALTIVFAALSIKHPNVAKLPQEKITVG